MQPQQSSRIDLGDLKAQIVKKLGHDKSKRYFFYLGKFLGQKLSKVEFDKVCVRVLGRENIQLHNQLIRSILKNACVAKTPPPINVSQSVLQASNNSPCREDGPEQAGSAFPNQNQSIPIWSNGVLPVSPRKGRSVLRGKFRDRPSPLGPNGKITSHLYQSTGTEDSSSKVITENGNVTLCDYQRPLQHLQAVAELPENDIEGAVQRPSEKPRIHPTEAAILEEGDEVEQSDPFSFLRGPLLPPLGIPFCSASVGGARKTLPVGSSGSSGDFLSCYDSIGLSDSETVRKRMEQIATAQGLEGVSMECPNILNNTLDVYLKQLIKSCFELVRARSTFEHTGHPIQKQQNQGKVINGMWPSNHLRVQNSNGRSEVLQEKSLECSLSLLDFKVAMELNPKQLGEDWPLLLEKISMRAFEE